MKNYVPVTLDQYINESKSITLKRGYGAKQPVVVGASAPIRNQVLAYVAEGQRVKSADLKRFVAGLNETNANPAAAATMWLRRNGKFFVTESRQGVTYYKLSPLGQRLVNRFASPAGLSEAQMNKKVGVLVRDKNGKEIIKDVEPGSEVITYINGKKVIKKAPMKMSESMERVSPEEFTAFVQGLIDSNMSAAQASYELKSFMDANPYMHEEIGEIEGRDMYKEGVDLFMDHFGYKMSESKKYDFKDPKTKEPGIVDKDKEELDEHDLGGKLSSKLHNLLSKNQDKDDKEFDGFEDEITKKGNPLGVLTEERRKRIEQIIENIKSRQEKPLNEEEEEEKEEKEEGSADELSFDDLDLGSEEKEEGDEKEAEGEEKEDEGEEEKEEGEEEEAEGEEEKEEGEEDKVEITEFILTVDDVDAAIEELEEKGVTAEKVVDPDAEPEEGEEEAYKKDEISVKAEDWDELKGWLEEKGVDVEEMFGGEIEVEEVEDEEEGEEGEEGDMDLDLGGEEGEGEEGEGLDLDLAGEDDEELELDLEGEGEEVEESLTGMENHEDDTNNLIKGAKQVIINYK